MKLNPKAEGKPVEAGQNQCYVILLSSVEHVRAKLFM